MIFNNDSTKEVIAVSYQSNEENWNDPSAAIFMFNSKTNALEWQSDSAFLYANAGGVWDCKIDDLYNNGKKELIIATGQLDAGQIWIIDPVKDSILQFYENAMNSDIEQFHLMTVDDIDGDGKKEIIAESYEYIYVYDPNDFKLKWQSPSMWDGENPPYKLMTGIIDKTSSKKIIGSFWSDKYL